MTEYKTRIVSKLFLLSSEDSLNGSFKSKFTISLPPIESMNILISAKLIFSHIEVTNSFYIINYTNDKLIINDITYNLVKGNYNANSFIAMVKILIPSITIIYNNQTNKFTFSSLTVFTISKQSTCKDVIGLIDDATATLNISTYSYEMPAVVNFLPLNRLMLHSNIVPSHSFTNSSINMADVIVCIQNNSVQQGLISWTNQTNQKIELPQNNVNFQNIEFRMTDDKNNEINFNNVPFYITLILELEYMIGLKLLYNDMVKLSIDNPDNYAELY